MPLPHRTRCWWLALGARVTQWVTSPACASRSSRLPASPWARCSAARRRSCAHKRAAARPGARRAPGQTQGGGDPSSAGWDVSRLNNTPARGCECTERVPPRVAINRESNTTVCQSPVCRCSPAPPPAPGTPTCVTSRSSCRGRWGLGAAMRAQGQCLPMEITWPCWGDAPLGLPLR